MLIRSMNKVYNDPFTIKYPHLDLHGETYETMMYPLVSFIKDNYLVGTKYVVIIHGRHGNVLKKRTLELLKSNEYVLEYHIDGNNDGQTIVELMPKK
jgi:dsDNA-specific endonuclease/ATPase MutS2